MFDYLSFCYWDLENHLVALGILVNICWLAYMFIEWCKTLIPAQRIIFGIIILVMVFYISVMWLCECCTVDGTLLGFWTFTEIPCLFNQLGIIARGRGIVRKV